MPASLKLNLSDEQRRELQAVCDHLKLPYMRERAAALLIIHATAHTAQDPVKTQMWACTIYL
jgi:hypothetical protein